jgi:hypothetical protein
LIRLWFPALRKEDSIIIVRWATYIVTADETMPDVVHLVFVSCINETPPSDDVRMMVAALLAAHPSFRRRQLFVSMSPVGSHVVVRGPISMVLSEGD